MPDNTETTAVNIEKIYDEEIAPALLALGKRCEEVGLPFLAVCEWAPGEIGRTEFAPADVGLAFKIVQIAARTTPNMDSLCMNVDRYCQNRGISTEASMYLRRFKDLQG